MLIQKELSYPFGLDPTKYAKFFLEECEIKEPPVDEKIIAEYLDIQIKEIWPDIVKNFCGQHIGIKKADLNQVLHLSAMLATRADGQQVIYTKADLSEERKRSNIFHEFGHAIIPWHQELAIHACSQTDIDECKFKTIEREAFQAGFELMIPRKFFVPDIYDSQIAIKNIVKLSKRYKASLEATAIWYAKINPRPCAVLMVQPVKNPGEIILPCHTISSIQTVLPIPEMFSQFKTKGPKKHPLEIKYSVCSSYFHHSIKQYQAINHNENNPIFKCWAIQKNIRGEIKSSDLGLSSYLGAYQIDCMYMPFNDSVLALVWTEDTTIKSVNFKGEILI